MKKFLLIIFIFFCCVSVNALEKQFASYDTLPGIMYYKKDGSTYYFRSAKEIKDTSTGATAYCLQPFTDLIDNLTYTSSDSHFDLSDELWNKVQLYAYYGYGYKGHTDTKWVTITQMSIWRAIYPNNKFEWVDPSTRVVINPYDKEINELNNLVNNHNKKPGIDTDIKTSIDTSLELNDSNNVIDNYKIIKSDFDARIDNNKLIINTKEEKEGYIELKKESNYYNNEFMLFKRNGSQALALRGNISPIDFRIKITVESGSIKVTKVDKDTDLIDPQGEASLDGAVYEVFDENMNLVESLTIKDNTATFENLKYGTYYVKEKSAGEGYYVDNEIYEVKINNDTIDQKVRLGNFVIKSKITIVKNYGSLEDFNSNKMKREKGIVFNVYDKNDDFVLTGITDEKGELTFELPYGEYVIRQMNTTEGYKKTDDYKLVVNSNNNISETIVFNDFKVKVPNAGTRWLFAWLIWAKPFYLH